MRQPKKNKYWKVTDWLKMETLEPEVSKDLASETFWKPLGNRKYDAELEQKQNTLYYTFKRNVYHRYTHSLNFV